MKIPNKIRIGGVDYEIQDVDHLNDGVSVCYGHISFEDSIIQLHSSNQTHQKKCITLWHEILHGITENACLEIEDADEETIIDVFAKGIYQVLQDNGRALFDIVERSDGDEAS
jgi:hypothetical protein